MAEQTGGIPPRGGDTRNHPEESQQPEAKAKDQAETIDDTAPHPPEAQKINSKPKAKSRAGSIPANKKIPLADELLATDDEEIVEILKEGSNNEKSDPKDTSPTNTTPSTPTIDEIAQNLNSRGILRKGGRSRRPPEIAISSPRYDEVQTPGGRIVKKLRFKPDDDAGSSADEATPKASSPRTPTPIRRSNPYSPLTPPSSVRMDVGIAPHRPKISPRALRHRSISNTSTRPPIQRRPSEPHHLVIEITKLRIDVQLARVMRLYLQGNWERMAPGLRRAQKFASDLCDAGLMARISFYQGLSRLGLGDLEGAYGFFRSAKDMPAVYEERRYLTYYLGGCKDVYGGGEGFVSREESSDVFSDGEVSGLLRKGAFDELFNTAS